MGAYASGATWVVQGRIGDMRAADTSGARTQPSGRSIEMLRAIIIAARDQKWQARRLWVYAHGLRGRVARLEPLKVAAA